MSSFVIFFDTKLQGLLGVLDYFQYDYPIPMGLAFSDPNININHWITLR